MPRWLWRWFARRMGRHDQAGPAQLRFASLFFRHFPGQITCREFEDFVYDYHEGNLAPRERETFEVHMILCPMCRAHLEAYRLTVELGRTVCERDDALPGGVPEELVQAILAARAERSV